MLSADQWRRYAAQIEKWGTPTHVGPTAGDCEDVVALLEAARDAEKQFRWYGDLHAQKKAYDKANRNYKFADTLRALLPQTGDGGTDHANVRHLTLEEQQTVSKALARSSKLIHKPAPVSEGEREPISQDAWQRAQDRAEIAFAQGRQCFDEQDSLRLACCAFAETLGIVFPEPRLEVEALSKREDG